MDVIVTFVSDCSLIGDSCALFNMGSNGVGSAWITCRLYLCKSDVAGAKVFPESRRVQKGARRPKTSLVLHVPRNPRRPGRESAARLRLCFVGYVTVQQQGI